MAVSLKILDNTVVSRGGRDEEKQPLRNLNRGYATPDQSPPLNVLAEGTGGFPSSFARSIGLLAGPMGLHAAAESSRDVGVPLAYFRLLQRRRLGRGYHTPDVPTGPRRGDLPQVLGEARQGLMASLSLTQLGSPPMKPAVGSHCELGEGRQCGDTAPEQEQREPEDGQQAGEADDDDEEEGKTSFAQAVFNLSNILMGVGILSLPFVLKLAGWAGGMAIVLAFAACTNYTAKLLGCCLLGDASPYHLSSLEETTQETTTRPQRIARVSFPEIADAAFSRSGGVVLATVVFFELFACLSIFLVQLGDHLHMLLPAFTAAQHSCFMAAVLLIPTALLRTPRLLSYLSAVGTASTICLVLSIAAASVYVYVHPTVMASGPPSFSTASFEHLPMALGLVAYAFSGHAIVPTVLSSLKHPKRDFRGVVDTAYVLVVGCCTLVAAAGYWMFGDEGTTDQVTLSLAAAFQSAPNAARVFVQGLTALMVLTAFSKFTLTLFPLALGLEEVAFARLVPSLAPCFKFIRTKDDFSTISIAIRSIIIAAALAVAVGVPSFSFLCSFVGLVCALTVSVIFPASAHLALFRHELSWLALSSDVALVLGGLFCAVAGTVATCHAAVTG